MILVDGNSIAARCFFGTHANTGEFDERLFTSAFIKSLMVSFKLMSSLDSKVIFCMDATSWRYKLLPDYKANRDKLKASVPYDAYKDCYTDICVAMKQMLPIAVLRKDPYEGDDLLSYFAFQVKDRGEKDPSKFGSFNTAIIVTTDKDMKQLYDPPRIQIYNPSTDSMEKVADAREHLQVLICTGDTSDNIPSLSPKKRDGKPKFRFGEKTVPSFIDWSGECGLSKEFWAKLDDAEKDTFRKGYDLNKRLIDLSLSPIHGDDIEMPDFGHYSYKKVEEFFRTYANQAYEAQGRQIQETFAIFGSGR